MPDPRPFPPDDDASGDASGWRAAIRLALRWRRHEAVSAWRWFRGHRLRDRLAVGLGVPAIGTYALATAAAALARDHPALLEHRPGVLAAVFAGNLLLALLAARRHRVRSRRRLGAAWLAVLPLGPRLRRRIGAADAVVLLLPPLALLLLVEAVLSSCGRLPAATLAAAGGLLPGLAPALLPGDAPPPLRAGPATTGTIPVGSPSAPPAVRGFPRRDLSAAPLRRLDRAAPRRMSLWCARLVRGGISLPLLVSQASGWLLFAGASAAAPGSAQPLRAASPALAVLGGLAVFAATLRTAPLRSPVLRSLPLSYPRLLFGAARVPLLVSLLAVLPLEAVAAPAIRPAPVPLATPPAIVLLLDGSFLVFAAHFPGRGGLALFSWTATMGFTLYEWPKFGLSGLLLPLLVVALMVRRGLHRSPVARRSEAPPA